MSRVITVHDNDDMPCLDWNHGVSKLCPMREKWHEGEIRMCGECGWRIAYNCEEDL